MVPFGDGLPGCVSSCGEAGGILMVVSGAAGRELAERVLYLSSSAFDGETLRAASSFALILVAGGAGISRLLSLVGLG